MKASGGITSVSCWRDGYRQQAALQSHRATKIKGVFDPRGDCTPLCRCDAAGLVRVENRKDLIVFPKSGSTLGRSRIFASKTTDNAGGFQKL